MCFRDPLNNAINLALIGKQTHVPSGMFRDISHFGCMTSEFQLKVRCFVALGVVVCLLCIKAFIGNALGLCSTLRVYLPMTLSHLYSFSTVIE